MQLIFDRTGPNGSIGNQVRQIAMIFRVKDFLGTSKARFPNNPFMHLAAGKNPLEHVLPTVGIGLMKHTFIANTNGARFIGIDAGNEEKRLLDFFLDAGKARAVLGDRVFVISRTRSNDEKEPGILSCQDVPDFLIPTRFDLIKARIHRVLHFKLLR
ncbi:unknown [Acidaminococcus intestini CAG:325]|nr:unknown [Acidaminococcus intestini CAG:325]